jgi:hypothetical protein
MAITRSGLSVRIEPIVCRSCGPVSTPPNHAIYIAELFDRAIFLHIVFIGANAPTTVHQFPRGEAIHYREHAIERSVPSEAIRVEPAATNTGQNVEFARRMLADEGVRMRSVLLVSRPYQQRRAFATCRKLWPEVDVLCSSRPLPLDEYIASIGDAKRVINMLVGDTQRITEYAKRGFAASQSARAVRTSLSAGGAAGRVSSSAATRRTR